MTRRLIEEWLPVAELGIESTRERTPMTPFPAPNRLHVWWARRPLVASRAAVLASLLPADADHKKFMDVLGIHGDPVAAKEAMEEAKRRGIRVENPYSYPRAFSYSPTREEKAWVANEAKKIGIESVSILDPTAGGGSIPFEALRLGLNIYANDLNPVASFIEKMTFEAPLSYGEGVLQEYRRLEKILRARLEKELKDFFPQLKSPDILDTTYLWARTLRCPHCGGLIPLSPNWRLAPDGTGVRLIPHEDSRTCSFEIVYRASEQSKETVKGGDAICPFHDCGHIIVGDKVKDIAQSEGLGEQLFAIVYKERKSVAGKVDKWVRGYRAPRPEDDIFDSIKEKLEDKLPRWEADDIVPTEEIPEGLKTSEPLRYGVKSWLNLFSPRQLYCHCTSVEIFHKLLDEEQAKGELSEAQKAAFGYMAVAIDKLLDYNCRRVTWIPLRQVVGHSFQEHDFSFKWSYAEMAPLIVGLGYDWAFKQVEKCLIELTALLRPDVNKENIKQGKLPGTSSFTPPQLDISCQSADALLHIQDKSIGAVVMDPPYYDNVMYAELSDFFYVWLKRTAGSIYPELFQFYFTDKENEAVANPSRFSGEKGAKVLAGQAYKERMAAIFSECKRVLKDDGILTLMFTHKATGAWDALAKGLISAGFSITASWPINTEASGSLHIKDKAAANSTIFLVCRPRTEQNEISFWEDLEPEVRKEVVKRVDQFKNQGIQGIDLYLSCFGPALETFSKHWPVQRSQSRSKVEEGQDPYAVTPEDVLETARKAVKEWRFKQIAALDRKTWLDPVLEWFVLAWDTFKAPKFPFDEALSLARVVGIDMSEIIGFIAEKKASDVILWDSDTRASKNKLGANDGSRTMLDALHHAIIISKNSGIADACNMLKENGLATDQRFLDSLKMVLEVLPSSHASTEGDIPKTVEGTAKDFEVLEKLRVYGFSERVNRPVQLKLYEEAK